MVMISPLDLRRLTNSVHSERYTRVTRSSESPPDVICFTNKRDFSFIQITGSLICSVDQRDQLTCVSHQLPGLDHNELLAIGC